MKLQFGNLSINEKTIARLNELGFTPETLQEAIYEHQSNCDGEPTVYVGTYAKYNEGSICGLWIDLTSFSSYYDFVQFCKAIHSDEEDPELMAQDYEGFPSSYYYEGFINENDFDKIIEYSQLCEKYPAEAVSAYIESIGSDDISNFEYDYCGEWDDEEDYARHVIEECYDIDRTMGHLSIYFDYEAFARDLFMTDYRMAEGYVFRVA